MSKHLAPEDVRVRSPRKPLGIVPIVILAVLTLFCIATAFVAVKSAAMHRNMLSTTVSLFVPSAESKFGKSRVYLMILGIDYNYDDKDQEYSAGARSDTIMVAGLDFTTHAIKLISVPRDMAAHFGGHEDKINGAYAAGGTKKADAVIGDWLGMPKATTDTYFDRYVVLKVNAAKSVVDAIGGIDVPVTENLNYDDSWGHLHIHFKPGMTHMNGEQAISYARFRHDACSDPCRIKRQQQVMKIIVKKLKDDKLNDLAHITQLIPIVQKNVVTNLSSDEIVSLANDFSNVNLADFKAEQIPFTGDKDTSYAGNLLIPDEVGRAKLVADLTGTYANVPPPPVVAAATIAPAKIRVDVENGSGEPGLGGKMAAELTKKGFIVASVANAASFGYETTEIHTHAPIVGLGERVRAEMAFPAAQIAPDPRPTTTTTVAPTTTAALTKHPTDVTVIVGRDYVAHLSEAAAPKPVKTP